MNYVEFVDRYAVESGRTKVEANEICGQMLNILMDTLLKGNDINVYGFGKICVKEINVAAIDGIDGVHHPAHTKKKLRFSASKVFEKRLNDYVE